MHKNSRGSLSSSRSASNIELGASKVTKEDKDDNFMEERIEGAGEAIAEKGMKTNVEATDAFKSDSFGKLLSGGGIG